MKKLIIIGIICMGMFLAGCSNYDNVKMYEDTAIVKETYTKRVRVGTTYRRRYYTMLMYKGDTYKISGKKYNEWAENRIEQRVNINVEDYIKDGEIVKRGVSIDEYRMID
ncbi:hypothetical protein [Terrisporobacter sp.]|uniref:hypothetical protein n=1 Tax=Terrisporobacter sp. TaxID=1965305 RepID=UPI0039962EBD